MSGPWVDDVELFICCRCGALVAWVDQPGGPDKDGMTEHNVFHGLSRNRARVDTKGYRYLGEIQTRVRDGPSGGPLVSVSEVKQTDPVAWHDSPHDQEPA